MQSTSTSKQDGLIVRVRTRRDRAIPLEPSQGHTLIDNFDLHAACRRLLATRLTRSLGARLPRRLPAGANFSTAINNKNLPN